MPPRGSGTSSIEGPPGLFRRYRVVMRVRTGHDGEELVIEVPARTQGAARRSALRDHPSHVVVRIERVD
jgi:hypothetical protein